MKKIDKSRKKRYNNVKIYACCGQCPMSIELYSIKKHYFEGKVRKEILRGIDLSVRRGEIFALTGANGAGKTTLLKILATLVLPDSGTAVIAGNDIRNAAKAVRGSVGLVFDAERSFYQILSVEQNLRFFASLWGIPRDVREQRIGRLLSDFHLEEWRTAKFSHCSSGIRQKLAIVRAFLNDPQVLLIDELTRSLDSSAADEVSAYIDRRVRAENKSCILVTHDRVRANAMGYRIGMLSEGTIKE